MVLVGIIGEMRSGKTLFMTLLLYEKMKEGYPIFSNYFLNFEHETLDVNDLDLAIRHGDTKKYENAVIAIDEIHVFLDSRSSGQKRNRMLSYFITQSGKLDTTIYWTSQFLRQPDVRLRLNTQIIYKITRYAKEKGKIIKLRQSDKRTNFFIKVEKFELQDTFRGLDFVKVGEKNLFNLDKYFYLYDTKQAINYQEQIVEKKGGEKNEQD